MPADSKALPFDTTPFCIDFHHHHYPPGFVDESEGVRAKDPFGAAQRANRGQWTFQTSLDEMNQFGVAQAILSVGSAWGHIDDIWNGTTARKLVRGYNDFGASLVADHPSRFGLFATLPMLDIEGSLQEIAYAFDTLKADGIGLYTNYQRKYLGDPYFAPIMEELNRRKALIYTHPTELKGTESLIADLNPATIEFGTDTTRTIASLVFSGASSRYQDINFIFSHGGGTMPFLIERFVNRANLPQVASNLPFGLLHELQRFYYECAQSTNMGVMASLTRMVPVSQILFGTDFPMRKTEAHRRRLRTDCEFSEADLRAIERENGLRLLPRFR